MEFHLSFYHWVQRVLLQLFVVTFSLAADIKLLKVVKLFTPFPRPLMNILNRNNYWRFLLKCSFHCEKWPLATVLFLLFYAVIRTCYCISVKGLWELLEDPSTLHFLYRFYPYWLAPLEGSNRIVRHDFLLRKLQWPFPSLSCLALSWIILFFVMVSTALVQKLLTALYFLQTFFLGLMVYLLSAMSLAPAGYKW